MNPEQFIVSCMLLTALCVGIALHAVGVGTAATVFAGLAVVAGLSAVCGAASMQQVLLIDQSDDEEGNDNEW